MFLVAWEWTNTAIAASAISTVAILVGALILAAAQITALKRNHAAEILSEHVKRWNDERLEEARLKIRELGTARSIWDAIDQARNVNSLDYFIFQRIPAFFEQIGIMCLVSKSVPHYLVYEFFAPVIANYWHQYEPWIRDFRNQRGDNRVYEWFEKLGQEMDEITKRRDIVPP